MTVQDTLVARQSVHGDFALNARISQDLKQLFCKYDGYSGLSDIARESLDLIATKLSRILSSGQGHADNWHDIAGYATLAEREVQGQAMIKELEQELHRIPEQGQLFVGVPNGQARH